MQSPSILLIEDNPINLAITVAMLRSIGAQTDTAETAAEAQARMRGAKTYSLLLMDIQLPDGDGISLAREYHALGGTAPILFLSSPETAAACSTLQSGNHGFLEKPFTLKQLQEAITALS